MRPSRRIRGIVTGEDDGWSVHYRAEAMRRAGEPVIALTVGDHDVKTDASILDAMKASMDAGNLGYAAVSGAPGLREAIAARATRRAKTPAGPENVVVTPGGQYALYSSCLAAMEPGQSCIVLDPHYATYEQTMRAASIEPIKVVCAAADGFQPDVERIAAALRPDTGAILINSPNNPTGAVYRRDRLDALAGLCRERGLWLLSDEVYDTQVWEGEHISARDLPGMAERAMVIGSLSKSHAMTGCRMGWVLAPAEVQKRLADLLNVTNYGLPGFIQDAAEFAIREARAAEAAVVERYRRRRGAALRALGNGPGFRLVPPQGGMYVMLDIRETGLSGVDFACRLLAEERVAVMPGESFGEACAGHLRIALTAPEDRLTEALGRISRFAGRLA